MIYKLLVPISVLAQVERSETAPVLRAVAELRRQFDHTGLSVEDTLRPLSYRGRPAFEIKGRVADDSARRIHDFAVFDRGTGRIAVYILFSNASRRQNGEAILPMSEISTRADALVRFIVPRPTLNLEGIQRYRASGQEGVYYEVRYAPQSGEIRYLQPPVRLLVDASTGNFFRCDVEPEMLDPLPVPKSRITRQAGERIAVVTLRDKNLEPMFGSGAVFGKIIGADLFYASPNDWLGFAAADPTARARVVWVIGFTVAGVAEKGPCSLFVDTGSGRVVGGMPGSP